MNTTDFIIKVMDEIASSVEGISIRYAFEKSTGFHIVEVSPEVLRTRDETYKKLVHLFRVNFHKEFPLEDIIISKVSDLHDMSNIVYELISNTCEIELPKYEAIIEKVSCKKARAYKFQDTCDYIKESENNYALAA